MPTKIAARSPFKSRADLLACAQDEVRTVLAAVTEAELFVKAHGDGDADG